MEKLWDLKSEGTRNEEGGMTNPAYLSREPAAYYLRWSSRTLSPAPAAPLAQDLPQVALGEAN